MQEGTIVEGMTWLSGHTKRQAFTALSEEAPRFLSAREASWSVRLVAERDPRRARLDPLRCASERVGRPPSGKPESLPGRRGAAR